MSALSNADLLSYIDGNATPEVAAEIEASEAYRQRVRQLVQFENNLTAEFYRVKCPDLHQLGEYQLRLLPGPETLVMRAHLAACPLCRAELIQLEDFLTPRPGLAEQIRIALARLISGGGPAHGLLAPAAGTRGGEQAPLQYSTGDLEVLLEILPDQEAAGRRTIVGLIIGALPAQAHVELFAKGDLESRAPVDELGNFRLEGLQPQTYRLVIVSPDVEVYLPGVAVR